MLKIGDCVGGVYQTTEGWALTEDTINKIVETKSGKRYYTKSKFRPLIGDEVDENTIMQKSNSFILTSEVFQLNEATRRKVENWIKRANSKLK